MSSWQLLQCYCCQPKNSSSEKKVKCSHSSIKRAFLPVILWLQKNMNVNVGIFMYRFLSWFNPKTGQFHCTLPQIQCIPWLQKDIRLQPWHSYNFCNLVIGSQKLEWCNFAPYCNCEFGPLLKNSIISVTSHDKAWNSIIMHGGLILEGPKAVKISLCIQNK